jgi:hypothetical protein
MERQDPTTTDPTCGECAHARIAGDVLNKRICGRYPPAVFPIQAQGTIAAIALRPEVKTTDHACGEFRPKH